MAVTERDGHFHIHLEIRLVYKAVQFSVRSDVLFASIATSVQ
jgi:hypothetical protein